MSFANNVLVKRSQTQEKSLCDYVHTKFKYWQNGYDIINQVVVTSGINERSNWKKGDFCAISWSGWLLPVILWLYYYNWCTFLSVHYTETVKVYLKKWPSLEIRCYSWFNTNYFHSSIMSTYGFSQQALSSLRLEMECPPLPNSLHALAHFPGYDANTSSSSLWNMFGQCFIPTEIVPEQFAPNPYLELIKRKFACGICELPALTY